MKVFKLHCFKNQHRFFYIFLLCDHKTSSSVYAKYKYADWRARIEERRWIKGTNGKRGLTFFYVQSSVLSTFCIATDKMQDERTPNITPKLATDNKKPKHHQPVTERLLTLTLPRPDFIVRRVFPLQKARRMKRVVTRSMRRMLFADIHFTEWSCRGLLWVVIFTILSQGLGCVETTNWFAHET